MEIRIEPEFIKCINDSLTHSNIKWLKSGYGGNRYEFKIYCDKKYDNVIDKINALFSLQSYQCDETMSMILLKQCYHIIDVDIHNTIIIELYSKKPFGNSDIETDIRQLYRSNGFRMRRNLTTEHLINMVVSDIANLLINTIFKSIVFEYGDRINEDYKLSKSQIRNDIINDILN